MRIRIRHFLSMWIRIQIQGFDDQKMEKKITAEKNYLFYDKKIAIYLTLGLHKGRPRYMRSLSKENIEHLNFLHCCGSF
jgi:hypothetical protein